MQTAPTNMARRIDSAAGRLAVALTAVVFCYAGVLASLVDTWSTSPMYSYGFAVPLISGYMLWSKWQKLQTLRLAPDYLYGVPVMLVGTAMLIAGHLGALITLQQASLIVTLTGLVLLICGRDAFMLLWFPIAYLALMVPLWDYPIDKLQEPSRLLSGAIALTLLRLANVPSLQEGPTILLPHLTLQILRECSGVNQLIAITAMTLPASYLFLDGRWRRIVLLAVAVALAYLSNGIRIATVGLLAYKGLSDGHLVGLHLVEGLLISVVGYAVLGGCLSLLSRKSVREPGAEDAISAVQVEQSAPSPMRRRLVEAGVLGLMLFAGAYVLLFKSIDMRLTEELQLFPRQIDSWTIDTTVEPVTARFPAIDDATLDAYPSASGGRRFAAVDDELVRAYRGPTGERVRLYIGYHRYQQDGKELTGEASRLLGAAASLVPLRLESETVAVNEVVRRTTGIERGLLFWYDVNGRTIPNIYLAKAYTLWDALTRRRTNGAVIMVEWESPTGGQSGVARQGAIGFVRALLPLLPGYMPS